LEAVVNEMTKSNSSSPMNLAGPFASPAELTLWKGSPFKRLLLALFCWAGSLMAGCHSTLVIQTPVGPEPLAAQTAGSNSYLLVFSAKEARGDGDDPIYYQHSDYRIYDPRGKRVKYVGNSAGHFDQAPRRVQLPPGRYTLKARAECYDLVVVPVVIESGRTTVVHLEKEWKPASSLQKSELVNLPGGYVIGWSASPSTLTNHHQNPSSEQVNR
jgi:hypothetical protein